jgi:5,10-methylene-tetrahydrofolate dehydrogenase/methenyl tetrahydrofolate cyclohydrolase
VKVTANYFSLWHSRIHQKKLKGVSLKNNTSKLQHESQDDRYFEELDQMEAELGGILVAGPNPKHKNEETLVTDINPKQKED